MERLLIVCAALSTGCGDGGPVGTVDEENGSPDAGSAQESIVVFPDSSLEQAVRSALGEVEGSLTPEALLRLTELDASGLGIAELKGIDQLKNLQTLVLRDNRIEDISSISSLM